MIIYSQFNDNLDLIAHRELGNASYAIDILKTNPELAEFGMFLPLRTPIILPKIEHVATPAQTLTKIF